MVPPSTTVTNHLKILDVIAEVGKSKQTGVLFEADADTNDGALSADITQFKKAEKRKFELAWYLLIWFGYLHLTSLYGGYLFFFKAKWATVFFSIFLYTIGILGVTAGAHRLWSHRSYKAKWPMRLILIIFNAIAYQYSAFHWARDHRVHHKFSETDADPHNATRGLFFSHIGWVFCKKHPDVIAKGNSIDISDLRADSILMFQEKYYKILMPLACFILPTLLPMYLWNESIFNSWYVATVFRWCCTLNSICCINSFAHKFGGRPYDKNLNPAQNLAVAAVAFGEGWHNYHHVFPWDYKTSEWGNYPLNFTNAFIDFFAKIGWAYDLKSVAPDIIEKRVRRTGDGTHEVWGFGDKDITPEDQESIIIHNKKTE